MLNSRVKIAVSLLVITVFTLIILCGFIGWRIHKMRPLAFTFTDNLLSSLRKTVDPIQVQQWAVGIIQSNQSNAHPGPLEIPAALRDTKATGPDVLIGNSESNSCVLFIWGGGFGHYGLAVGNKDYQLNNLDVAYSNKWIDGVYVFADKN